MPYVDTLLSDKVQALMYHYHYLELMLIDKIGFLHKNFLMLQNNYRQTF